MKRATSLVGLLRQAMSVRWNAASRGAKVAAIALVAFAGVSAAQALTCGACSSSCSAVAESAPVAVEAEADQGCAYHNR
jgi:hypothetical protein